MEDGCGAGDLLGASQIGAIRGKGGGLAIVYASKLEKVGSMRVNGSNRFI